MSVAMMIFVGLIASVAQAGSLLDEMQVQDTCGTTYADKLAACTPFRCTKPSPMAMMFGFPSEEELQKMPPERQKKMRASMAAAEKKMQSMSPAERVVMKAKMVSTLEIKGYNAQHQCQIETGMSPNDVMRCAYDAPMLKRVSAFERIIAKADHVESENSGSTVNGKWVTKSVTKVDGKIIDNPLVEAMNKKICKTLEKDADQGLIDLDQLNRMSHFKFNLSEHGKHVDGHIQILNATDDKVLFDKDVKTSISMRKINLKPGTFDIKVTSKNPQLAPVWFRKIKLGEANVFKKDVEFYAISGTLKLTVNLNGKPSKGAALYIKDPDTKKWLGKWSFWKKPTFSFMPARIKLPETLSGRYQVFVTAVPTGLSVPHNAKYKDFLLTIKKGETVEKVIDFGNVPHAANKVGMHSRRTVKSAGESANTLFILDASGSMWGQIIGKPKITIAKEVMAKLVPELSDNARIGLIAYGHRRKGDCNDVETLVELTVNDKQAVLKAVNGLNAKGKTPLTRSVNQAIDMLRSEENSSTIILVSDGIESCGGDPCAAVKAAKASGVNFILHTVGFGLSKKESAQLQCMARAGGGEYFQANNAEELLKSARKAVQPVGILKLTAKVNGAVVNLLYRVEDTSTGKVVAQPVLPTPSGFSIRLPAGQYKAFVSPAGVNGSSEKKLSLNIKAGEVINKTLIFGKGVLHLTVTENGKPAHAYIHMEDSTSHKSVYESSVFGWDTPLNIDLASGKVDVVVRVGEREQRVDGVEIVAGKTTKLVIPVDAKPATPIAVDANGMEMNTDRPGGGDFRHIVPKADDPALCQQACQSEAQCKSWTYVKPNTIQGAQPNCWLKSGVPPATHNTCCVSGVRH